MSEPAPRLEAQDRLLTFGVGASIYALPIACIAEVSETKPLSCIPMLPREVGGVINHHGDALPVLGRAALLAVDGRGLPEPGHILAIMARPTGSASLGLPVDRIVGLVDGAGATSRNEDPVAERRSIDGRIVFVLDPQRLVARAGQLIENSFGRSD